MTDCDFVAEILADGEWHSLGEILERSIRERGCGLTVHSRVSDLRKRGLVIENRTGANGAGRRDSSYRLVAAGVALTGGGTELAGGESALTMRADGGESILLGQTAAPTPSPSGGSPFDGLECIASSDPGAETGAVAAAAPESASEQLSLGAV